MTNKNICDQEQAVGPEQFPPFQIKLINKFDEDERDIRVWHKGEPYILYHLKSDCNPKQKDCIDLKQYGQQKPYDERTFSLAPEDSLIIELAEEGGFTEINKDLYFELPFIADYKLSFEWKVWDEKERVYKRIHVDRPVSCITRDTTPNPEKPTEDGKTVVRIPGDQRAWKLEIWSPRNLKEHCHPKKVLTKHLEMTNGRPDSSSVGDNGP